MIQAVIQEPAYSVGETKSATPIRCATKQPIWSDLPYSEPTCDSGPSRDMGRSWVEIAASAVLACGMAGAAFAAYALLARSFVELLVRYSSMDLLRSMAGM